MKSCNNSPATAEETQTTAATPSTTATPPGPETPSATISSAAMISVESVKSGNRIVGGTDHADQISGNGGEKESDDQHHDGRHHAAHDLPGHVDIQRDHERGTRPPISANTVFDLM